MRGLKYVPFVVLGVLAMARCTSSSEAGATVNSDAVTTGDGAGGSDTTNPDPSDTTDPGPGDDAAGLDDATATEDATAVDGATVGEDGSVGDDTTVTEAACSTCHGSATNFAPPQDTQGNSETTFRGVGAHQSHLGSILSSPIACSECHVVPTTLGAVGHVDSALPAEITFGTLASSSGATPTWDSATTTCSTYCHGATLTGGGTLKTPNWTVVDGTQIACGTCHAMSPKTGRHPSNWNKHKFMGQDCTYCHKGQTNTAGTTIENVAGHINGVKDVSFKQGGTWTATTKRCAPSCHGKENW